MQRTERDVDILKSLDRYGLMLARQIRQLHFPEDRDVSTTRARLRQLEAVGWIGRRRALVAVEPSSTAPVWHNTERALCELAMATGDASYLDHNLPNSKLWANNAHNAAVTEVLMGVDAAVAAQRKVRITRFFMEHTAIPQPKGPSIRLATVTQEQPKRILSLPDAGLELEDDEGQCMAYYWELETGKNMPKRAAALKAPGYHTLFSTRKFKLHFRVDDFRVVAVTPSAGWRDALRAAMKDKPGNEKWRFVAMPDLGQTIFGPVFYKVTDVPPVPLASPGPPPAPVVVDGRAKRG